MYAQGQQAFRRQRRGMNSADVTWRPSKGRIDAASAGQSNTLRAVKPTGQRSSARTTSASEQARRFVWGSTASQLTSIQKHFGKLPDREILTDQQRQEAIEAARGKRKEAA